MFVAIDRKGLIKYQLCGGARASVRRPSCRDWLSALRSKLALPLHMSISYIRILPWVSLILPIVGTVGARDLVAKMSDLPSGRSSVTIKGKINTKIHFNGRVIVVVVISSTTKLTWQFASFFPIRESGWWYSFDCDNERLLVSMLLLQANPSLSQSNANRHADIKRPIESTIFGRLPLHPLTHCLPRCSF
jgi:hypothetical protein